MPSIPDYNVLWQAGENLRLGTMKTINSDQLRFFYQTGMVRGASVLDDPWLFTSQVHVPTGRKESAPRGLCPSSPGFTDRPRGGNDGVGGFHGVGEVGEC